MTMPTPLFIGSGLIGLGLLIAVVWRLASRRQTLPCPAWLGWMVELDNPFTKTNRAHVIIGHLGLRPGMAVQVMADDYGRDPVAGTLVASSADHIAIRREDPRVGEVVVHFPRAGFWVLAG